MEHRYVKLEDAPEAKVVNLLQRDNNIDGSDNLDSLPTEPAVYALCCRVHGNPVNVRYVGATGDLQREIMSIFDKGIAASDEMHCAKEFVLSIKSKMLIFKVCPGMTLEQLETEKNIWRERFQPECNKELNEVY